MQLVSGDYEKIYIENSRALSRSAVVSEQIYQTAKDNNVQIISADMPGLYNHNASPGESFVRRAMAAATEFERDLIVYRLQQGIQEDNI